MSWLANDALYLAIVFALSAVCAVLVGKIIHTGAHPRRDEPTERPPWRHNGSIPPWKRPR